jgi:hypothetical protein
MAESVRAPDHRPPRGPGSPDWVRVLIQACQAIAVVVITYWHHN